MVIVPMGALKASGSPIVMKVALDCAKIIFAILQHLIAHSVVRTASLGIHASYPAFQLVEIKCVIKALENALKDV